MTLPTIEQFEAGQVDIAGFDHQAHVYVAWAYLQKFELLEAIDRYRAALRRLTRQVGAEAKYHETITWFYLVSIAERLNAGTDADWPAFRRANPDLLGPPRNWLGRYYSSDCLASEQARRRFVLPDRILHSEGKPAAFRRRRAQGSGTP